MDKDCRGCNSSIAKLFDADASSTHRTVPEQINIVYGQGAVACNTIIDNVLFGGISMDDFTFGSCYGEIELSYPERYDLSRDFF